MTVFERTDEEFLKVLKVCLVILNYFVSPITSFIQIFLFVFLCRSWILIHSNM